MPDEQNQVPKHFIVIVPGFMGSKLRKRSTKELVWVNLSSMPWNPLNWKSWLDDLLQTMAYPSDLEPAGMMDEVVFLSPWAKMENYERLVKKLQSQGYKASMEQCFGFDGEQPPYNEKELNVYAFAHDWRQDNRKSAQQLGAAIEKWRQYHPGAGVWIIAHSNGGVVARWYIEKENGKACVKRLFLLGSPWDGTPKALYMAFNGFDTLFSRRFNLFDIPAKTRALVRSFPSIYQLIPSHNPFLRDANNQRVNPFTDGTWLDTSAREDLLRDAQQFLQDLGTNLSAETICFFGTRRLTATSGRVIFAATNKWETIEWDKETDAGDGTVTQQSAAHPAAKEKLPYPVSHGDIYVDEAVLEKLRYELIDKYRQTERATVVTSNLKVVFELENNPDSESGPQDFYTPGQKIRVWAKVSRRPDSAPEVPPISPEDALANNEREWLPVTDASIRVRLSWRQPLPGEKNPDATVNPPEKLPEIYLKQLDNGHYEGRLKAPDIEGCYEARATIAVPTEAALHLTELFAVEQIPDRSLLQKTENAQP